MTITPIQPAAQPQIIPVTAVTRDVIRSGGGRRLDVWLVDLRHPDDGTWIERDEQTGAETVKPLLRGVLFTPDTLDWRAAEYDLDPTDIPALLDLVLHERFLTLATHSPDDPTYVHNTDPVTAWTAHQARIATVKQSHQITDPAGHLAAIHAHVITAESLAAKRAHLADVRRLRAHV